MVKRTELRPWIAKRAWALPIVGTVLLLGLPVLFPWILIKTNMYEIKREIKRGSKEYISQCMRMFEKVIDK